VRIKIKSAHFMDHSALADRPPCKPNVTTYWHHCHGSGYATFIINHISRISRRRFICLREPDTSATRHFGITKLVPKFKTYHRWSCVSSELSWVEVSRLFLDHVTRVEVSRTTFLVSKCLGTGAEVSQSVLMPRCLVAEVSGNPVYNSGPAFNGITFYDRKCVICV